MPGSRRITRFFICCKRSTTERFWTHDTRLQTLLMDGWGVNKFQCCNWLLRPIYNTNNEENYSSYDNSTIHRSKEFMAKIAEWKQLDFIYFLPPYCPELNLIEILWRQIKYYWLPFDAFSDFQNLKESLSNTLKQIGTKGQIKFCWPLRMLLYLYYQRVFL